MEVELPGGFRSRVAGRLWRGAVQQFRTAFSSVFAQSKHSVSFDIHRRGGAPFGTDCGDIDCTLTVKRRSVFPERVVGDRL